MASKVLPSHIFSSIARPARRTAPVIFCASSSPSACLHNQRASQRRQTSTASSPPQASTVDETSTPRWQSTPPAMKAPVRIRGPEFDPNATVNSDPKKLDGFYARMLGDHSDKTLSEEVKWQAVTHKSFDQGRRGFNDRLAYLGMLPSNGCSDGCRCVAGADTMLLLALGKQIVMLQASLALLEGSPSKTPADPYERVPYGHPALNGVEVLSTNTRNKLLAKKKLSALAVDYGLHEVLRWLPRMVRDMTYGPPAP